MKKLRVVIAAVAVAGLFLFVNGCKKENSTPSPVACIQLSNDTIFAGQSVSFTNCSTNGTSYLWNFGDGASSASSSVSHTYTVAGTYTVTLSATNTQGTSTTTKTIVVKQPVTSANYVGTYSCSDICDSGNYTYQMSVIANGATGIRMGNFGDWGQSVIINATINGTAITIPSQNFPYNGATYSISGSGTADGDILVLTINSVTTDGTYNENCVTTATKQ